MAPRAVVVVGGVVRGVVMRGLARAKGRRRRRWWRSAGMRVEDMLMLGEPDGVDVGSCAFE